ncbi:hypothetical protein [Halobacillus mangrovi]|uniref:Uncharacterized protein n=1 Tax=Halobacillus mangrovi TaxID=402384 RepID=A0A1W5ZSC8_9BACI|nr:hypothetical protein [Halobacillus mangrovi]ARI76220.1 hypothetical protein HM131_04940 [Halobacillus mangrovi]
MNVKTMWVDENKALGIVEVEDRTFGSAFHPVKYVAPNKGEFLVINRLWYTTYNGAREFFRAKTNAHIISGRLKKMKAG